MKQKQNGPVFAGILKNSFLNNIYCILIEVALNFIFYIKSAFVQVMACC